MKIAAALSRLMMVLRSTVGFIRSLRRRRTIAKPTRWRELSFRLLGFLFLAVGAMGIVIAILAGLPQLGLSKPDMPTTLGALAVGLGFYALYLSLKAERQSERILTNTEGSYNMVIGQMGLGTVYPTPMEVDTQPKCILALDALRGPITDIKVTIFFPPLDSDDCLTVTVKVQEPVQRNSEDAIWSSRDVEIRGPRMSPGFEEFKLDQCMTQMGVWIRNSNQSKKIVVKAVQSYVR